METTKKCCGNCDWRVYFRDFNRDFCYKKEKNVTEKDEPCEDWTPFQIYWHDF